MVVQPRAKGYVARSSKSGVTAFGSSAIAAAENARHMAMAMFRPETWPAMLLVRIDGPRSSTIVMQPFDRPVAIEAAGSELGWRLAALAGSDEGTE
jgi:hypothetical protein